MPVITEHKLKTWPKWFEAVIEGRKTFELRNNDRDFREGDRLVLREWDPETKCYSGRVAACEVTYVMAAPEILPTHVILGITRVRPGVIFMLWNDR